jgi:hypothetical protein
MTLTVAGYVIVSSDGRIATAGRVVPESLQFPADQAFLKEALDASALVVHGRHSQEDEGISASRKRLVVTRSVTAFAFDPLRPQIAHWNPAGLDFETACARVGVADGGVAILGGPGVYDHFLDRYDAFFVSRAPYVRMPDGIAVFSEVERGATPEAVLAAHGLKAAGERVLDPAAGVTVTLWLREPRQ